MPQPIGIGVTEEMTPGDQHIGGNYKLRTAPHLDERCVVANAEHRVSGTMREIAADQLELGNHASFMNWELLSALDRTGVLALLVGVIGNPFLLQCIRKVKIDGRKHEEHDCERARGVGWQK